MTGPIRRRLEALEGAAAQPAGRCHVLTYGIGESADDAMARAPGPGAYLLVPEVLRPEIWAPLAQAQQAELMVGEDRLLA